MTQYKSNCSKQNMNNMINEAKQEAIQMNKKSTNNSNCEKSTEKTNFRNKTEKNPNTIPLLGDLFGNFNLSLNFDDDTLLLVALLYILYKQQADTKLLIALIYVLFF